jgi:GGDEF domain-containing protein
MQTLPLIDFDMLLQTASEATAAYIETGIDPLTGLPDRKVWDIERRKPCTARYLLYLDLNGLKAVNDTHGHTIGDMYLRTAAANLKERFQRKTDAVFHPHGDEFIVLTDHAPNPDDFPKFSIGCVEIIDGDIAQAVIGADAAMYVAKRAKKAQR